QRQVRTVHRVGAIGVASREVVVYGRAALRRDVAGVRHKRPRIDRAERTVRHARRDVLQGADRKAFEPRHAVIHPRLGAMTPIRRLTPDAYSSTFGESRPFRIFVATPGMLVPTNGRPWPPFPLNHANSCCSATSVVTSGPPALALIDGPWYAHWKVAGLPAAA